MQLRSATKPTRKAVASPTGKLQLTTPPPKPQSLYLTDLPIEILLNVIYQGDLKNLLALRRACKAFHNLSQAQDSILKNWTEIHHLDDYVSPLGSLTYPERINRAFARSQFANAILNTIRVQNVNPENRPIRCSRKRLRSLALLLDEVNLTGRDPSDIIEGRMTVGMNHVFIFGAMITCTLLLKRLYYDDLRMDDSKLRAAVVRNGIEWTMNTLSSTETADGKALKRRIAQYHARTGYVSPVSLLP